MFGQLNKFIVSEWTISLNFFEDHLTLPTWPFQFPNGWFLLTFPHIRGKKSSKWSIRRNGPFGEIIHSAKCPFKSKALISFVYHKICDLLLDIKLFFSTDFWSDFLLQIIVFFQNFNWWNLKGLICLNQTTFFRRFHFWFMCSFWQFCAMKIKFFPMLMWFKNYLFAN